MGDDNDYDYGSSSSSFYGSSDYTPRKAKKETGKEGAIVPIDSLIRSGDIPNIYEGATEAFGEAGDEEARKFATRVNPYMYSIDKEISKASAIINPKKFISSRVGELADVNQTIMQEFKEWYNNKKKKFNPIQLEIAAKKKLNDLYQESLLEVGFKYPMSAVGTAEMAAVPGSRAIAKLPHVSTAGGLAPKKKRKAKAKGKGKKK